MSNILASHINIYTSPDFYHFNLETPQRPFHNLHSEFSISLNITKYVCSLWNLLPNSISHEVPHTSSPGGNPWCSAPIRELPRGAWLSDVTHHPTRYHENTVQITFIFIGQTRLVFGKRVCTCATKHSNAFRTFLNWLKNSKRVLHEPKLHISRLPLFAHFDLWSVNVWWV